MSGALSAILGGSGGCDAALGALALAARAALLALPRSRGPATARSRMSSVLSGRRAGATMPPRRIALITPQGYRPRRGPRHEPYVYKRGGAFLTLCTVRSTGCACFARGRARVARLPATLTGGWVDRAVIERRPSWVARAVLRAPGAGGGRRQVVGCGTATVRARPGPAQGRGELTFTAPPRGATSPREPAPHPHPHPHTSPPRSQPESYATSRSASATASARLSTTGTPTPSRLARLCDPPV